MSNPTLAIMALLATLHPVAPPPPAPPSPSPQKDTDPAERGKELLVAQCGFCHGSNARGGSGGSDLTRSPIVQEDEGGKGLGAFLKVGRPDRGMPKFDLKAEDVSDLAAFLHATIAQVANRDDYRILDIVTGDAKAGGAFFRSAGCGTCHSVDGDLKGVGARYDPATLQGRLLMPRGDDDDASSKERIPPYRRRNAIQAKVTPASGEATVGALVVLTDFDVTLYDAQARQMRTWLRKGGVPQVELTDPLQAHVDFLRKWTDRDMHDMTAFLAGLK